jgi:glycosyltransferase involved in cell wall biosynthesis
MITPIKFRAWAVNSVLINFRKLGSNTAQTILNSFDIIHFYGPYNFLVATCEIQVPFVSTEHGTLRDYIFSEYAQAKMSRIGYQLSAAVIVTNQDSYPSALKTGVASEKIIFGPHPINENDFRKLNLERLGFASKHPKVLIPARQVKRSSIDAGKGNNEILHAIKQSIENNLGIEFLIPLWGDNVQDTLKLAEKLSILDHIKWLPLLSRPALKKIMNESIAVIDQLNVRAYGAVGADALALGVPLITAAGLQNDELAFGSMAPVLDATTADDIYRHLEMLVHGNFDYSNHANISQEWFKKHISMEIATSRSFDAYDINFNSSSD